MHELLEASTRFPTVIFTVGLGICLVYWLFVVLGALDIDVFGGDVAGAAKGAGEALGDVGGAAKALGDVGGAAKALGDAGGAAKGAGEAAKGAYADGGGILHALGLASVPITISFSVVTLLGWTISILAMHYVRPQIGGLGGWLPAVVLFAAIVVAGVIGGLLVRPLAPVFKVNVGKRNRDYVGATCTITTGRVDDDFGQATLEDGGTVLVIPVRCDRAGALVRGQRALVIDFDPARQAYVVEPADPFEPDPGADVAKE
jgi:hypothetical protein